MPIDIYAKYECPKGEPGPRGARTYVDAERAKDAICECALTEDEKMMLIRRINRIPKTDTISVTPRLLEIIEADKEGRLKIRAKLREETCGSCRHYQHESGISTGLCDCRTVFDRRKGVQNGEPLYVTSSRKRCKDDYEPREEAEERSG